jgi:hypothetical protein
MTQKDNISICIQDTLHKNKILKLKDCRLWLSSIFQRNSSITIRIVDKKESELFENHDLHDIHNHGQSQV